MEMHQEVEALRQSLKSNNDFIINPIDLSLPVIPPFRGGGEIKLIILGQDPTIKKVASRAKITCTLNLDKNNALKTYVIRICEGLGISIENVFATNLFKYFYTERPAGTIEVLKAHLEPNLVLLKQELEEFKSLPIITLGEPVLQLLTHNNNKVHKYWDYNPKAKECSGNFTFSSAEQNKLNRDFYPLPHQPSIRYNLYNSNLLNYLSLMKI